MGNKGFLKRVLPFLATFAVSVFILSVVFGMRPGPFRGRGHHRGKMKAEVERLKAENEALANENLRLRNEMRDGPDFEWEGTGYHFAIPHDENPLMGVPAPPPPIAPRHK